MVGEAERFFDEFPVRIREVAREVPEIPQAFNAFFRSIMRDGALSVREKQLIAVAVGMAVRCRPCINVHVEEAMAAGATRKQILEAAGVVVLMQGGPSYACLPQLMDAIDAVQARKEPTAKLQQGMAHADT